MPDNSKVAVALTEPNGFVVLDRNDGSILRQGTVEGYLGWDVWQAVLCSYPYVLAGARRPLDKAMAYDLVALNFETGKVDWTFELDRQGSISPSPRSELMNFIYSERTVYLSRLDGQVMAFRVGK